MVDERVCINNFCVCLICYGLMLLVARHKDTGKHSRSARPHLRRASRRACILFPGKLSSELISRGVPQRSQLLLRPGIVL